MGNSTPRLPLVARDEWLRPAEKELELRHRLYEERLAEILRAAGSLTDYANGYRYYGWQRDEDLDVASARVSLLPVSCGDRKSVV